MVVHPPGTPGTIATPAESWARLIVLSAAAVGAAAVVARFYQRRVRTLRAG
jgi:hypothetical protein